VSLIVVGLSHKTAPLELREKFALDESGQVQAYEALRKRKPLSELVFLSTCNRVEMYAWADPVQEGWKVLKQYFQDLHAADEEPLRQALYQLEGEDSLNHLLRVAASLDSMVLGEAQILGQVKAAYALAVKHKVVGPALHGIFSRVFNAAKEVRSQTAVGQFSASVPSVAVELARRLYADLSGRRGLLLGTGEIGRLTAEHLRSAGLGQLTVANRTLASARELAGRTGAQAAELERLPELLKSSDVVVCATAASEPVVQAPVLRQALAARHFAPMLLVDLSVPRNIDPACDGMEQVYLYNIDDLQKLAAEHLEKRQAASLEAAQVLKKHQEEIHEWISARRLVPALAALNKKTEALRQAEWEKVKPKLAHLTKKDQERVEHLTKSLVAKILNTPFSRLRKDADSGPAQVEANLRVLRELFDLERDEE
jgi:glutamyl-tRNA reductase